MKDNKLRVEWIDGGREAHCPPDPRFPDGVVITAPTDKPYCTTALPYPAKRCGVFLVTCEICGMRVVVSAAGRADDPKAIEIPCKGH